MLGLAAAPVKASDRQAIKCLMGRPVAPTQQTAKAPTAVGLSQGPE